MKKKITSALFFFCFSVICYSQSTLQFSQVLLLVNGSSYTVPANRVWKITGITSTAQAFSSSGALSATINSTASYLAAFNTSYSTFLLANGNIIWLPSGTTITPTNNTRLISVVEFITSP